MASLQWTGAGGVDGEVTTASIPVPGLRAPLRMLHISDTHIGVTDGGDRVKPPALTSDSQAAELTSALARARSEGASLVLHTGDCIQGASQGNVQFVEQAVAEAGLPFYYISGNADWMDPIPSPEQKTSPAPADRASSLAAAASSRAHWREAALTPLYGGAGKSHWVREHEHGLTIVGVVSFVSTTFSRSRSRFSLFRGVIRAPGSGAGQLN